MRVNALLTIFDSQGGIAAQENEMDKKGLTGFEKISLNQRSDEFSEQFSTPVDRRFWIRVETPWSDRVVISDVLFGDQDEYAMGDALLQALSLLNIRQPTELVFRNLGSPDDVETGIKAQRIERMVEAMVMHQRRFIVGRDFDISRDKVNLVVRFKHFV